MGWAIALTQATRADARMTFYGWDCRCIVKAVMMTMGVCAQDSNSLSDDKILPPQKSPVRIVAPARVYQQEPL